MIFGLVILTLDSDCCRSVTRSCPTLCDSMSCSTPGFPVLHCLPELAQTHVHQVGDATQPSHPLLSPFPPALSLSQHHQWPQPAASAAVDRAHSQQPSPLLKWSAIRFKNGKYNFLTGKTGLMSVLTLKHPGGEVGDESWSQASGPREQWPSPGKRSRGFWPMVLVNWMCPLFMCQQAG